MKILVAVGLVLITACTRWVGGSSGGDGRPVMDLVPAGAMVVGCQPEEPECPAFNPQRTVTGRALWIDRYEVTHTQYASCIGAGRCKGVASEGKSPVAVDTIDEARAYCAWRGARLPTSVEWERAARGFDARPYPWGTAAPDCKRAGYSLCVRNRDHVITAGAWDVGTHAAGVGPFGTHDLAGSVTEWTECGDVRDPRCHAIERGHHYAGPEALRTYAGHMVLVPTTENYFYLPQGAGIRCVRDSE